MIARPWRRALAAALVGGLLALAPRSGAQPPSTLHAQTVEGYRLVASWPHAQPGHPQQALPWPEGHQIGGLGSGGGRLLATDLTRPGVHVWDAHGRVLAFLEGVDSAPSPTARPADAEDGAVSARGPLQAPRDVAALPDGRLAIADSGNDRLVLWSASGQPLRAWAVRQPLGTVVYDGGEGPRVAVVSGRDRQIVGIDPDGGVELRLPLSRSARPENLAWAGVVGLGGPTFYVTDAFPSSAGVHQVSRGFALREALTGITAIAAPPLGQASYRALDLTFVAQAGAGVLPLSRREALRRGTATVAPLENVGDLEIDDARRVVAAVPGVGPVMLGDVDALRRDLEEHYGRAVGPRAVAAGQEVLLVGGHARVRAWRAGGAAWERSLPSGAIDVALDPPAAYVLTDDGLVRQLGGAHDGATSRRWLDTVQHPVAVDAAGGRVALLDLRAQAVELFDEGLVRLGRVELAGEGAAFHGVVDLAVAPLSRRLFLARPGARLLEIRDAAGRSEAELVVPTGPARVAAGPEDRAFVLTSDGWVVRWEPEGRASAAFDVGGGLGTPVDLSVDGRGRVVVAYAGGGVRIFAPDPRAEPGTPPTVARCAARVSAEAQPSRVTLGEAARVRVVVSGGCPSEVATSDVVLAIDRSGSMAGAKLAAARDAALDLAARLDPLLARVAVVAFARDAERVLALTSDRRPLVDAVLGLRLEGWTDLVRALEAARDELATSARPSATRAVVLLSDGRHWDPARGEVGDPEGLDAIGDELRARNVEVYAIGLGGDANAALLDRVATSPGHRYTSPSPAELRTIYSRIARRIEARSLFRELVVTETLAADMELVVGSLQPEGAEWAPRSRTVRWRLADVPEPDAELGFTVRPSQAGRRAVGRAGGARFVDGFGAPGRLAVPQPVLEVVAPSPTPSPTPPAAPTPERAFLPLALRQRCGPERLHVILALDASSSVQARDAPATKAQVQRAAAVALLEAMDLERDRISVVRFDAQAAVIARGHDRARLQRAVRGMRPGRGTRLDRALDTAVSELRAQRALVDGTTRAIVLLVSDGVPSAGTGEAARRAAHSLRTAGVRLVPFALGADADTAFLAELAGGSGPPARIDGPGALQAWYERGAAELSPCPPGWPAR